MGIEWVFTPHGLLIRHKTFSSGIESCNSLHILNAMIVGDTQRIKKFSAYNNVWDSHGFSHFKVS